MSWQKYFQIVSIIILSLTGIYFISPKYTFNDKGNHRKNIYSGKVEYLVDGKWETPEDYHRESDASYGSFNVDNAVPYNSNDDSKDWVPVNEANSK